MAPEASTTASAGQGWDETYDFVIVGSGAASVPASLAVQDAGKRPLIIEKNDVVGGSTALSGGVLWIPNNSVMKAAGVHDTPEDAKAYLDACAGPYAPGSTPERRAAFLEAGPRMVDFLIGKGMKFVHAEGWGDYHVDHYPGGVARSRSLVAQIFDARELGPWRKRVARMAGRPPLRLYEAAALFLYGKTWASKVAMVKVGLRLLRNRLGADLVGTGAAVQGRLFQIALRNKVPIWTDSPVSEIVVEDGRAVGVVAQRDGKPVRVRALDGVLINSGGFSRNMQMREKHQMRPTNLAWTLSNKGDTGEVLTMAMELGAATNNMDLSWWNSVSIKPDGGIAGNVMDISKPHAIMVDQSAQRYVNESTSYVAVGLAMYERDKTVAAVPSWCVFDSQHREHYLWSGAKPGKPPQDWLDSGYLVEAETLEDLAGKCGLDPAALRATVDRFNGFARAGVDEDFKRSFSRYDQFFGDPTNKPAPNLGTLERGPFYAVKMFPGDVGTAGGIVADEFARVIRTDGGVIQNLYATGNSTAPVVGRSYPGAGASIASSAVFGYIAARHAIGAND